MKFTKTLGAFGVAGVALSALASGPAVSALENPAPSASDSSVVGDAATSPVEVSATSPSAVAGQAVEAVVTVRGDADARLQITAPAGTTITGVDDPAAIIAADGGSATLDVVAADAAVEHTVALQVDAGASGVLSGGLVQVVQQGAVAGATEFSVDAEVPPAPIVTGPELTPGATSGPISVTYEQSVQGVVTFTAPAGTSIRTATIVTAGPARGDTCTIADGGTSVSCVGAAGGDDFTLGAGVALEVTLAVDAATPAGAVTGRLESRLAASAGGAVTGGGDVRLTVVAAQPAPVPLVVTSPSVGGEAAGASPTFSGTAAPFATIEIVGQSGRLLASTVADRDGDWSVVWNGTYAPGRYAGGAVRQLVDGDLVDRVIYDFTLTTGALVVDAPAIGGEFRGQSPTFSGVATPGAAIRVVGMTGRELGKTVADADGAWSLTWNGTYAPGRYAGGVVEQRVGGVLRGSLPYDFVLKPASTTRPFAVTSPAVGGTTTDARPTFTGGGTTGATIEIRGAAAYGSRLLGTGVVDADGVWAVTWDVSVLPARYAGGTVTELIDGTPVGDPFVYDFSVVAN